MQVGATGRVGAVLAVTLATAFLAAYLLAPSPARADTHTVTYDHYSLNIDGKRMYIWSGEFHYWRPPSRACGATCWRS